MTAQADRLTPPASSGKHPLGGQVMTGADIVIQVLADEGVDILFGYSGGAILPTWDALARYNLEQESKRGKPIELVVPANEQGAGFMNTIRLTDACNFLDPLRKPLVINFPGRLRY